MYIDERQDSLTHRIHPKKLTRPSPLQSLRRTLPHKTQLPRHPSRKMATPILTSTANQQKQNINSTQEPLIIHKTLTTTQKHTLSIKSCTSISIFM